MRIFLLLSIVFVFCQCRKNEVETVKIKGSDTEVNLVLQLAETFMDSDPAVSISITGGGSGVGIAALLNRKTDIANSSRELTPQEILMASQRGVHFIPHVFAADAIAVITHPSVGIDSLSVRDLGRVYAGEIVDWQQLGGKPGKISLYGRQSNSGTFIYFREKVLGKDFSPMLKQMNGTAQIIEAIKNDPQGIGYAGLGYVSDHNGIPREGFKVLKIKAKEHEFSCSPLDTDALRSGLYPLTRPLYQFTNGQAKGKIAAFLAFEKSDMARKIILQNGYLPAAEAGLVQHISQ